MVSRSLLGVVVAGLVLWGMPGCRMADPPAPVRSVEGGGWNQGRVAAVAEAFADEVAKLKLEADKIPPDISFSQQRAQYELQESIRLLKNESAYLARQLKAGKGREETRPIYKRMQQLRADAEEEARRTLVPEQLMDRILAAGVQLLQLQPYYREPEARP